jgi:hypothetical protein
VEFGQALFYLLDSNGDGEATLEEIKRAIEDFSGSVLNEEALEKLNKELGEDGQLNNVEFQVVMDTFFGRFNY